VERSIGAQFALRQMTMVGSLVGEIALADWHAISLHDQ
jgi:hypothetical protein